MNPYEPPQSELPNLKGPERSTLWLVFIFGFPVLMVIVVLFLLG